MNLKPSDRILQIKESLQKDKILSEQECVNIAVITYLDEEWERNTWKSVPCEDYKGTGTFGNFKCPYCEGQGRIKSI